MKKLFIMALMAVAASSSFAQDVKSILKAKDYAEAKSMLQSCESTLSNEDKAKAYNKLVQLSLEKFNKESAIMSENQVMQQMGQKGDKPVDKEGMYAALAKALNDAVECDKYDKLPNAKGKVAPKFHKKNQNTFWPLRVHLIYAGQDCQEKGDNNGAFNYYATYVNSGTSALFDDFDKKKLPDANLGNVARVAGWIAYQAKNMDDANKYIDIALNDTASYKDALGLKMAMMQQSMKTKEDSIKSLNTFEDLYAKDKSEDIFANLATLYGNLNMKDKQMKLIDERLASDPNCFTAWAIKGQAEMNENKLDEAIADLKKANEIKPNALVLTWLGYCNNNKAANTQDANQQKALLTETQAYLEKAKELDPDQKEANWRYLLYNTYYNLYGADDSRTKAMDPNNK